MVLAYVLAVIEPVEANDHFKVTFGDDFEVSRLDLKVGAHIVEGVNHHQIGEF